MDLTTALLNRRSIRQYANTRVDESIILALLEKAQWAPSACNRQGHSVVFITREETKRGLVDLGGAPFVVNAPAVLIFLYEKTSDNLEYHDNIQSAGALVQNFLLLAHEAQLATCWICHLPTKRALRRLLNIPSGIEPIAAVTVGRSEQLGAIAAMPRRRAAKDFFYRERWPEGMVMPRQRGLALKAIARMIYMRLPRSIKKKVNPLVHKYFVKKFPPA